MGSISLGIFLVAGNERVPQPATGIITLRIFFMHASAVTTPRIIRIHSIFLQKPDKSKQKAKKRPHIVILLNSLIFSVCRYRRVAGVRAGVFHRGSAPAHVFRHGDSQRDRVRGNRDRVARRNGTPENTENMPGMLEGIFSGPRRSYPSSFGWGEYRADASKFSYYGNKASSLSNPESVPI
jgi:hypothetical protein